MISVTGQEKWTEWSVCRSIRLLLVALCVNDHHTVISDNDEGCMSLMMEIPLLLIHVDGIFANMIWQKLRVGHEAASFAAIP